MDPSATGNLTFGDYHIPVDRPGRRLIYLPDCGFLAKDTFDYLQTAMMFAWGDDPVRVHEVKSLPSEDELRKFFKRNGRDLFFIVDQVDALDELTAGQHRKFEILALLDTCRLHSQTLLCMSANNTSYLTTLHQQSNERKYRVYGGFTGVSHICFLDLTGGERF
jgi:hypothetical protein